MANTTFRITLVFLFIVAVVHGRNQDRREDRGDVDKTRDELRTRSDKNFVRNQDQAKRGQDEGRRYQNDDRRDQDNRTERYQRKQKDPNQKKRTRGRRGQQYDYQRNRHQDHREQQDNYQRERNQDRSERNDDYERKTEEDLRQNNHKIIDNQNQRDRSNHVQKDRSQHSNQQQVKTIKDNTAERRRIYRERRERERQLRQIIKQDRRQRQENVERHRLRCQDEDRRQIDEDRSNNDVDFRSRYNHRGLSPQKILLLGVLYPPLDSKLRGENIDEIQLRDQIIVYDDGTPQRNNDDVQEQTESPLRHTDQERLRNQQNRKDEDLFDFGNNGDVKDQYRQLIDSIREKSYFKDYYAQSYENGNAELNPYHLHPLFKYHNPLMSDNNKKYDYYNRATSQYIVNPSYKDDDEAVLQGNYFLENLQLNDKALGEMLNVVQNLTRGNTKSFYELETLNTLDVLTEDGLCHGDDSHYDRRYDIIFPMAIAETRLYPLKIALKVYTRMMNIQAAIQDIRDIIDDTQEEFCDDDGLAAAECNKIIGESILASPDRDFLVYEAENLNLIAEAASIFLVDFKPEIEEAVLSGNVFTYFSKSKQQIKPFIDKLVRARAHASITTLDC